MFHRRCRGPQDRKLCLIEFVVLGYKSVLPFPENLSLLLKGSLEFEEGYGITGLT